MMGGTEMRSCGGDVISSFLKVFSLCRPSADPESNGINIVIRGWMQRNLINEILHTE